MLNQKMVGTETIVTKTISPGERHTCEIPTLCNDLHTTAAPPGLGESGYGTPYKVEPVSSSITETLNALEDLAETGMLHNDVVGMELSPYAETLGQIELWMRAGDSMGKPYTWDTVAAALLPKLASSLGRQPKEEELKTVMQPIKIDISSLKIKLQPDAVQEHLRLLGGELAEKVLAGTGLSGPVPSSAVCSCNRIII